MRFGSRSHRDVATKMSFNELFADNRAAAAFIPRPAGK